MSASRCSMIGLVLLQCLAVVQGNAQSPLANGTAAHVWLVDESGETVATYNVSAGQWTQSALPAGNQTSVAHSAGATLLGVDPGEYAAVLVNQTQTSLPAAAPGAPAFSVVGIGRAIANPDNPTLPAVTVSPQAGTFDHTLAVKMTAHAPASAPGASNVELLYRINGGAWQSAAGTHTHYLVADGSHTLEARASVQVGAAVFTSPTLSRSYQIAGAGPITRDSDNDGIPDLFEAAHHLNPLADDFAQDNDGDGWSDFEELIRGGDPFDPDDAPLDSDGDGWSDFDEQVRGTNPNDPEALIDPDHFYPSRPVARHLREVELILSGAVYRDGQNQQTALGALAVLGLDWGTLYDQAEVPDAQFLLQNGLNETDLPPYLQPGIVAAALAAGNLPPLRTPAGEPGVVRVGHLNAEGDLDGWNAKAWLSEVADLHPSQVGAFLEARGETFATAGEWAQAYTDYLTENAVQQRALAVGPDSSALVALMESGIEWAADAAVPVPVLLGNPGAGFKPTGAVAAIAAVLDAGDRDFAGLATELADLLVAGAALESFATDVRAVFANFVPSPEPAATSTSLNVAALVQGDPIDDNALARYLVRLYIVEGQAVLDALSAEELAVWLDPAADADLDSVHNAAELALPPTFAGAVGDANSDGDQYSDAFDPCPGEAANTCLAQLGLNGDSDADGVIDALDNCLNDPNPDQTETVAPGIGDACLRFANIRTPAHHPTVLAGTSVSFTSLATGLLHEAPLSYEWYFDGAQPTSSQPDPGEVVFSQPGVYDISLTVTDAGGTSMLADVRRVVVLNSGLNVAVGGPYQVTEGQVLALQANALAENAPIEAIVWSFGDGGDTATGAAVEHAWDQQGSYTLAVAVTDALGLTAVAETSVAVTDTLPSAVFAVSELMDGSKDFEDFSSAYDGIVARTWDFGDGSPAVTAIDPTHTFPEPGIYTVSLEVIDGDGSASLVTDSVAVGPVTRDSDGDGMPDIFETAHGLNPFVDDFELDSDADGWSDFEELIRGSARFDAGSQPADSDGDGWSDFDEGVRGTNPDDPALLADPGDPARYYPSRPVAQHRRQVEYILSGLVFQDAAHTLPQLDLGGLSVVNLDWNAFYDQAEVPTAQSLTALGLVEADLPPYLRPGAVEAALAAGTLAPVRLPGGVPSIVQVGQRGPAGDLNGWRAKAWLGETPDLHPAAVTAFLDAAGQSISSAEEWTAGYVAYLTATAVQPRDLQIGPDTSALVALIESGIAWAAGPAENQLVLLGEADAALKPVAAVATIAELLATGERGFDALAVELSALLTAGAPLESFAAEVDGIFLAPPADPPGATTAQHIATLVQGDPLDDDPLARYLVRLYIEQGQGVLSGLSAEELAEWLDPAGDADGDGVSNAAELALPP